MEKAEKEKSEELDQKEHKPLIVGNLKVWEVSDTEENKDRRHLAQ